MPCHTHNISENCSALFVVICSEEFELAFSEEKCCLNHLLFLVYGCNTILEVDEPTVQQLEAGRRLRYCLEI